MTDPGAFDLDAYLARIDYDRPLRIDAACLADLHEAHMAAIPFENLDIFLGQPIRIDLPSVWAKLVTAKRGGYCYEHSTLFKAVLERIGFRCRLLAARVVFGAAGMPRPRGHFLLEVDTPQGQYLADVGFGLDGPLHPMPLLPDLVHHQPGSAHRLRHDGGLWVLEGNVGTGWDDLYSFTLEPQLPVDMEVANHYTSTYPGSIFRRTLTVQRLRRNRRASLRGTTLQIRVHDRSEEYEVTASDALLALLADEFGLVFPAGTRFTSPEASSAEPSGSDAVGSLQPSSYPDFPSRT